MSQRRLLLITTFILLITLTLSITAIGAENPQDWIKKGITFFKDGYYDEALNCFQKAIEADSKNVSAWYNKGRVLFVKEKYDEALSCFETAISLDPTYAKAWGNKANILYLKKQYDDSLKYYNKAIELDPKYDFAWYGKACILIDRNNYDEALSCLDKSLELNPNNTGAQSKRDTILAEKNKKQAAQEAVVNGKSLYSQKQYDSAISSFNKAIELDSKNYDAWYNKGLALNEQGNWKDGETCFTKALELKPGDVDAGKMKEEAGKIKSAVEMVKKGNELLLKGEELLNKTKSINDTIIQEAKNSNSTLSILLGGVPYTQTQQYKEKAEEAKRYNHEASTCIKEAYSYYDNALNITHNLKLEDFAHGSVITFLRHSIYYSGNPRQIFDFAISQGADVNAKYDPYDQGTLLYTACMKANKDIVELLLLKGADVNAKIHNSGNTPLHVAVGKKNKDIVELLLLKGANVNIENTNGKTPLDYAETLGLTEIIELLKKYQKK